MDDDAHMLVHPSSLGWTHIDGNLWRKPDGNTVQFIPGSSPAVVLTDEEAERQREKLRYGIG